MIVTRENLNIIPENEQNLIESLLNTIDEYNGYGFNLNIYYQDYHDEYSPERTEPCPDYYGCYRLFYNDTMIGVEMTADELDSSICLITDLFDCLV